jgi:hypothetical protein
MTKQSGEPLTPILTGRSRNDVTPERSKAATNRRVVVQPAGPSAMLNKSSGRSAPSISETATQIYPRLPAANPDLVEERPPGKFQHAIEEGKRVPADKKDFHT